MQSDLLDLCNILPLRDPRLITVLRPATEGSGTGAVTTNSPSASHVAEYVGRGIGIVRMRS